MFSQGNEQCLKLQLLLPHNAVRFCPLVQLAESSTVLQVRPPDVLVCSSAVLRREWDIDPGTKERKLQLVFKLWSQHTLRWAVQELYSCQCTVRQQGEGGSV